MSLPRSSRTARAFPAAVLRKAGVDPESLVSRIASRVRDIERDEERLRKQFELPPFLKHFATNLNLLARQDKLPPVFGRNTEIQQVVEVLSHRERANSVMLVGEPGVGKTAIAEGLARRIEFEPESIPVRLRDCQVDQPAVEQPGRRHMLRGMFEDRIQNVLRELKERPNLILFIDEAHTLIGAGSALGAPADAANVLKGVWPAAKSASSARRRSASTKSSSRKTRRWRAASAPCTSPSHRSTKRDASSATSARASSATTA
jgi:ATP-dependent Clp protease ATP-binding subunit ClpA